MREEKLARLRFTEADRKALAFVPPGPLPTEQLADQGVTWAKALLRKRAQHASIRHATDESGYCYRCQDWFAVEGEPG